MGRIAYDKEDFYHTIRWMSEALEQAELEGENSAVDVATVLDYLSYATAQQGNILQAYELTKRLLSLSKYFQMRVFVITEFKAVFNSRLIYSQYSKRDIFDGIFCLNPVFIF